MSIHKAVSALFAGLFVVAASAGAQAPADWKRAVATLHGAGFQSVEELETTADGGFEAEVFDAGQQAFELLLDATGAIRSQRLEAQASAEERIEMDVLTRLLAWPWPA